MRPSLPHALNVALSVDMSPHGVGSCCPLQGQYLEVQAQTRVSLIDDVT